MNSDSPARNMTVGSLALASGLTIEALRHYHDVRLLVPAEVDGVTGYRRYSFEQVRRAQAIRVLRSIHMPLEEIAEILAQEHPDLNARPSRNTENGSGREPMNWKSHWQPLTV